MVSLETVLWQVPPGLHSFGFVLVCFIYVSLHSATASCHSPCSYSPFFTVLHHVGKAKAWRWAEHNDKALVRLALELQTHLEVLQYRALQLCLFPPAAKPGLFFLILLASLPPWCVPDVFSAVKPSNLHFRCGSLAPVHTQNMQTCISDHSLWTVKVCEK